MKRITTLFALITISILLIGCNIKIGDGVLTVSEEGVQYITSNQSDVIDNNDTTHIGNEDAEDGQMVESEDGSNGSKIPDDGRTNDVPGDSLPGLNSLDDADLDEFKKMAEELAKIGEELWKDFSSDEFRSNSNQNQYQCREDINQNYTDVQNKLNHEFYFPPCADLISIKEQESILQFVLEQRFDDQGSKSDQYFIEAMEIIEDGYVELGSNDVYENYIDIEDTYGEVKFYLHGDEQGHTHVYFKYWGDHIEITVTYKHPNFE